MKKVEYKGYTVYENGDVFNKFEKQLSKIKNKKSSTLSYCIRYDNNQHLIPCGRFVYQAFNQDKDLTGYIVKTLAYGDYSLNNLYLVELNKLRYTHFNKMKLKKDIFNRMMNYRENNKLELANELLWVLGGEECDKKKEN